MQLVAFGLAGCMAIDVASIVTRGRHLAGLSARLDAHRVNAQPARFVKMDLHYVVAGNVRTRPSSGPSVVSATCCSVWHSLRETSSSA
jgi:uncharacterized OsmC-like protein